MKTFPVSTARILPPRGAPVPLEARLSILQRVEEEIRTKGKITHRRLQEILLYEPGDGFYSRYLRIGVGPACHFGTRPVEFSPLYGRAFARRMLRYFELMGPFAPSADLVALGDGDGTFFSDILLELKNRPETNRRLRKTSIELVPRFARMQEEKLAGYGVKVINGSAVEVGKQLKEVDGLLFAHEMFDQFPVNKVVWRRGRLWEIYFTKKGEAIVEEEGPLSTPEISDYFKITGKLPQPGRPCVISLDALRLFRDLSQILRRGVFFIIDYNTADCGLHAVEHSRFGRRVTLDSQSLWPAIGRDITTDVDFEALKLIAGHFGFNVIGDVSDREFLHDFVPDNIHRQLGPPIKVLILHRK